MKCLNCENEMENGFVQSNQQIFYATKKHKGHLAPSKEDIRLTGLDFGVPSVEAWCCKKCRTIVMKY